MKKSFLIMAVTCFLIGFNRVSGQALLVSPGDTFTFAGVFNSLTDSTVSNEINGLVNNYWSKPDTIYWKVIQFSENSNWIGLSMCDPVNCYYYTSLGSSVHRFAADTGTSYTLQFGSSPNCIADSGRMQVLMWLQHDSAASATVITYKALYTGVCGTAAVSQIGASHLKIYPTLVSNQLTVEGLSNLTNTHVYLYDMLGNLLIHQQVNAAQNLLNLNTTSLQPGIYMVSVEAGGARVLTRRIEKLD